jgi:hypothetical protein
MVFRMRGEACSTHWKIRYAYFLRNSGPNTSVFMNVVILLIKHSAKKSLTELDRDRVQRRAFVMNF